MRIKWSKNSSGAQIFFWHYVQSNAAGWKIKKKWAVTFESSRPADN